MLSMRGWAMAIVSLMVVLLLGSSIFLEAIAPFYTLATYNTTYGLFGTLAPDSHETLLGLVPLFAILGFVLGIIGWNSARN